MDECRQLDEQTVNTGGLQMTSHHCKGRWGQEVISALRSDINMPKFCAVYSCANQSNQGKKWHMKARNLKSL